VLVPWGPTIQQIIIDTYPTYTHNSNQPTPIRQASGVHFTRDYVKARTMHSVYTTTQVAHESDELLSSIMFLYYKIWWKWRRKKEWKI